MRYELESCDPQKAKFHIPYYEGLPSLVECIKMLRDGYAGTYGERQHLMSKTLGNLLRYRKLRHVLFLYRYERRSINRLILQNIRLIGYMKTLSLA